MAAILRFGAEDLFKDDAAAEEARGQAVVEEDLDAILERAEVWRWAGAASLVHLVSGAAVLSGGSGLCPARSSPRLNPRRRCSCRCCC